MVYSYIAVVITFILAGFTSYYFTVPDKISSRVLYKALASVGFVVVGILSLIPRNCPDLIYSGGILLALILGLMGDMLLSLHPFLNKKEADKFNLAGMLCFLLGHVMYYIVFVRETGFNPWTIPFILILPIACFALIKMKIIEAQQKAPAFTLPILIYSLIISCMLVQGVYLYITGAIAPAALILIGSLLFVISDSTLIFHNFSRFSRKWMMPLCLMFYYSAQILFALSIFYY
jgi:uncharacterized membrane protein YhhN